MNNLRRYQKTNKYSNQIIPRNNLNNNRIDVLGMFFSSYKTTFQKRIMELFDQKFKM